MGVLQRARQVTATLATAEDRLPYVCVACATPFEEQHHSCPVCGSFDLRCSKWVQE